MKSLLKDYENEYEDQLNIPLMTKESDRPLVEYIIDSWKSLEVVKQIKFIRYEYNEKESEINANKYVFKREKKKKKKDRHEIKNIADDRCGLLTVYLEVTMLETNPTTEEKTYQVYPIKKSMLIPIQDEDGYYQIKGKKYYLIYQMLEKSTYTSSSSVTLKSLMPIAVKRNIVSFDDVDGINYDLPCYSVFVFRKEICIILFYLSKGIKFTLDYLHVANVISFIEKMSEEPDKRNIYFQLSSKCYLVVNRNMFNKYPYIQSVVGAFCTVCTNRTTLEQLDDPKQWVKKIANPANYEKGAGIVKYFSRLLDETTKKILKVPEYHSNDIYSLLRWVMEEFNELRLKDNLNLENKRLRCNEYIASLLTKEFSKRLNRIISMGDKVTIENIKELFKFSGDILIQKMHSSGILRFDDNVNDMNFWSKFKYTNKGPHSLGGNNSNNIGIRYRDLHPSFLGYIDVLVCGNSDPGTSGLFSPFSKIKGLYFNDENEPDSFYYDLCNDLKNEFKNTNKHYLTCDFDSADEMYEVLTNIKKFNDENITMYGTSRTGKYEIILNDNTDLDDNNSKIIATNGKKEEKDKKNKVKGEK